MNPHVRAKVRNRNKLRKEINAKREEWKAACQAVNKAIIMAKASSWNDLLQSTLTIQDPSKIWKIVRDHNCSPCGNVPNESLVHNGKSLTDLKGES